MSEANGLVPFSPADVCWCQPFTDIRHPDCPMHISEENLKRAIDFIRGAIEEMWESGESIWIDEDTTGE